MHCIYWLYYISQYQTFLHFSDLAKDLFIIENMAEADNSRVNNQQLEYPYGNVWLNLLLLQFASFLPYSAQLFVRITIILISFFKHYVDELLQTSVCHKLNMHLLSYCWLAHTHARTHTHTHPFNGPFSGTTRVSRYQKGKNQSGFYWSKRQWVAVVSAGSYASLHQDR